MKKLKNKFILGVIFLIALILFSQIYIAFSHANIDTNSYLTLLKGNGTLNEWTLDTEKKYLLSSGDKIRIIGDSSLGLIEWWDGSLTRLWWNTKISIEQNQISRDYTNINISFELIAGKTWSNVVSFIGEGSSFTQKFDGIEAGVRGTIFDVDLTQDFIHVTDHQVTLSNEQGETITITEGNALQISSFSFIELLDFLQSIQDSTWKKLNEDFDAEYFKELKKELSKSIEERNPFLFILEWFSPKYRILYELDTADQYVKVEKLLIKVSDSKKESVYKAVLSRYQDVNFITSRDYEMYKRKVFYKKALIYLADDYDKEALVRSSAYDLQDILQSGNNDLISETLWFLLEQKETLSRIDTSFLQEDFSLLPEWLKAQFQNDFSDIGDMFDIDFQSIPVKPQEILDNIDKGIQNFLDENAGALIEKFAQ